MLGNSEKKKHAASHGKKKKFYTFGLYKTWKNKYACTTASGTEFKDI